MSKSWTPEELAAASAAMKADGHMSYEEFCAYLERCTEKVVVVHLADGDTITTRIHGTDEDIRDYYRIGSMLNMGAGYDRLVEVVAVDITEFPGNALCAPVNKLHSRKMEQECRRPPGSKGAM